MSNLGPVLSQLMHRKRITEEAWGANFVILRQKIAILTLFHSLFARVWSYMNNYSKMLKFKSHWKNEIVSVPPPHFRSIPEHV